MTNEYYNDLNSYLFSLLKSNEIIKTSMWGENSQFIRLNNSKIRQTGIVADLSYSISLISNKRQVSCSFTLNGIIHNDKNLGILLSDMTYDEKLPVPFGIFYKEDKPTYENMMVEQIDNAIKSKGKPDLQSLIEGFETWEVK